jgi:hypothetical protein
MTSIIDRVHTWMAEAPWLALIVIIGMLIVFWWVMQLREVPAWAGAKARWLSVLVEAVALPALLFLILWGVRITLVRMERDFSHRHGRVSEVNLTSVERIWGKPHVQRDLVVEHSYTVPVTEEVRDQLGRIVTRTRQETRYVEQNSITRTRGDVTLTRSERTKGTAKYPGFLLDCRFRYTVTNFAERATNAQFVFPLSPGQSLIKGFRVLVNGVDQSRRLNLSSDTATWTLPMAPGAVDTVEITYASQGLQRFYYQIGDEREIRDLQLTLALPDIEPREVNYPEGCIPPTEGITRTADGQGSVLVWKLDRALTTRGMGIALPQPEQPGEDIARVLHIAGQGGMLLLVTLVITGIALGRGFNVLQLALVAGVYTGEFMLLAAVSDWVPTFWLAWMVAGGGAVLLTARILGWRRAHAAQLALATTFMLLYPLLALPDTQRASLLLAMDVLTVVYLAFLGLTALVRTRAASEA